MQITLEIIEEYAGYKVGDKIRFSMTEERSGGNLKLHKNKLIANLTLPPNVYKLVKCSAVPQ